MSANTVVRLIQQAYENAKVVGSGMEPNSEQYAKGFKRLTDLVAWEQTQGVKIFTIQEYSLALTQGLGTYTFGPLGTQVMAKPYRIDTCWYEDAQSIRRPMDRMTWDDYTRLPEDVNQGSVLKYLEDRQEALVTLKFWQLPDETAAAGTVKCLLRRQLVPYVTLNDDLQFAPEWFIGLAWLLADELASNQNQAIQANCRNKAGMYMGTLRDQDVEQGSISFSMDTGHGNDRHYW
jgi:hypothetical protein